MKNIGVILIAFLCLMSCDPCDDCGTVVFEPTATMIFINADSVAGIDSALVVFATIDSSLNANIDSLSTLRDSLQIVIDSIANGGSLINERNQLDQWILDRQADSTFFANENDGLDSVATVLNSTKTDINSGLLLISQLNMPETGSSLTYTDSASSWQFPLSFEKEFTLYELSINNELFTVELDYENFTEVNEERNVLIRAENIQVIGHTFDSLDACTENCIDGNATFIFYF